jgi:hypothetical protein
MRLTASVLAMIAAKVTELEKVGANVPEVRVAGCRVSLEYADSQREGATLWVTGIEPDVRTGRAAK